MADNEVWQRRYDRDIAHPHQLVLPPNNSIGKQFISAYAAEWQGIQEGCWNSERPLIFAACVLALKPGCYLAREIKPKVEKWLGLWEAKQP